MKQKPKERKGKTPPVHSREVRVIYPLEVGRILLRTEEDWTEDVEATGVNRNGEVHTFRVSSPREVLQFKACIADADGFYWAQGKNSVVDLTVQDPLEIYPCLLDHPGGVLTDLIVQPSEILGRDHRAIVYLPPGYFENVLKRYPVLYLHNEAPLFFPEAAYEGRAYDARGILQRLDALSSIDKRIVVAVQSPNRLQDYTDPGFAEYGRALVEELKPEIDRYFRTLDAPEDTGVLGTSLGGAASLFLCWNWPEVFGAAACLSGDLSRSGDLIQRIRSEEKRDVRIYLDSGASSGPRESARSLEQTLVERGYQRGKDLLYYSFPLSEQHPDLWATRALLPFQFFANNGVGARTSP